MNPYNQLMNPAAVGQHLMQSFQGGQQQRREMETQNALSQYATAAAGGNGIVAGDQTTKGTEEALRALARWNPQLAIQLRQREQEMALKGLEAHREKILMGAKIVRQVNPQDDAGWQQVRAMAQQVGIDLADVPPNFDPQYVQGLISVADAFDPQKQSNGQIVPFTPGGGVARFNPETQQIEVLVMPNDGSQVAGAPVQGNIPPLPPGFVLDGGPTPQASGGFPIGPL